MKNLRKTHPMVLVAATALTLFSLLGSAAITGLLPSAPEMSANANETIADQEPEKKTPPSTTSANSADSGHVACMNCGTVVGILALEGELNSTSGNKEYRMATAYQIKVRMHNGTYQTLVQHTRPQYLIGDVIRLERRQATV